MSDEQVSAPEVVQALPVPEDAQAALEASEESITQPAKLLRIATMVRELLEQTRQSDTGRARAQADGGHLRARRR